MRTAAASATIGAPWTFPGRQTWSSSAAAWSGAASPITWPGAARRDVLVLERDAVGAGTTSKAAGGIRAQFPTETEIRFSLEAIRVFERFEEEFGVDPGYRKIGYLFLISDAEDLRGFE